MVEHHESTEEDFVLEEGDDTSPEEVALEDEEESTKDKIKQLRKKLAVCQAEKDKSLEDLQRTRADFLNSKRRLEDQLARDRERITEKVLTDFLPLLDSFDTALAHDEDEPEHNAKWKKGVEAMHGQFMSLLKSYEIEEIETLGKKFDPREHEAVSNVPTEDTSHVDTVMAILQKGYKRKDTIIRPAKVIVGS